ncbi:cobalamin biosynthesis protein [Pseudooceanicola sp.]|uniref:cobalamin biosynthesis protein n=1 Tax=Pseudooceanicola sp. TaxID=1914328 RepID=UPI0035C6D3BC
MIVAGFGFRDAVQVDSLRNALLATGQAGRITALATAADKAQSPAFLTFAAVQGLPVHPVTHEAMTAQKTRTDSAVVRDLRQTGSVAEAAALAAAGPGARLICARVISEDSMATCAIACAPNEGDPE